MSDISEILTPVFKLFRGFIMTKHVYHFSKKLVKKYFKRSMTGGNAKEICDYVYQTKTFFEESIIKDELLSLYMKMSVQVRDGLGKYQILESSIYTLRWENG